jgi:hypothetical protein
MFGGAFAHHPTHGINDIGFAAPVRADNRRQIAMDRDGRGINKRFKSRQLDFFQLHKQAALHAKAIIISDIVANFDFLIFMFDSILECGRLIGLPYARTKPLSEQVPLARS